MEAATECLLSSWDTWSPSCPPISSALAPESSKQILTIQATLPPLEASKGPIQASDQGQRAEVAKDKGKSKETKPRSEAKDAATKAKEVEFKSKEADPEAKDASASQPTKKENLPPPRLSIRILFYFFFFSFVAFLVYFLFCSGILPLCIMYFSFQLMKRLYFSLYVPLFFFLVIFILWLV